MAKLEYLRWIDLSRSPIPWWEWDVINNTVTFNDLKATILGYPPERFRGKGYQAFTDIVHPADYESLMDAMRALLTGKTDLYQSDYRIRDSQGEYHWYVDRGFVVERKDERIARVRGLVLDLGKEKLAGADVEAIVGLLRQVSGNSNAVITMCSVCQRVRTGRNDWSPVTSDFSTIAADSLSHGLCPDCIRKSYPDLADRILKKM